VVAEAWALIQALPVNEAIQRSVESLQGSLGAGELTERSVDWASLLDPQSPLKLLYSLQVRKQRS
jgi:hypothetical protein